LIFKDFHSYPQGLEKSFKRDENEAILNGVKNYRRGCF